MASAKNEALDKKPPSSSNKPIAIRELTQEEEDEVVHTRLANDERPVRRVMKKLHTYTSLARTPIVPSPISLETRADDATSAVEEAREAFLVELASFQLLLKKSAIICDTEARQVEEYQREKQRINDEHGTLRGQIEQLKSSLEHAQTERRRKIEYDQVAEKVNALPTREELERSISALENDMQAIRLEHETQARSLNNRKVALDTIVSDLGSLRLMGKDPDGEPSAVPSPSATPLPELSNGENMDATTTTPGERIVTDQEEGEEQKVLDDLKRTPTPETGNAGNTEDDIEMGEVAEEKAELTGLKSKKKIREELEEGEATDASSELSEPPE